MKKSPIQELLDHIEDSKKAEKEYMEKKKNKKEEKKAPSKK